MKNVLTVALVFGGLAVALTGCEPAATDDLSEAGDAPASSEAPIHEEDEASSDLVGARWQLVEFQSMDDETGTMQPEEPSLYTLSFNADSTITTRLNCNRGTGRWSAAPSGDGMSGSVTISDLAVTQMLCPPPSMDEQIARDFSFVRGYLLRGGNLSLSLMADAGIYVWEPID